MRKLNLVGERYGKLTVINSAPNIGRWTCWQCLCDCGKTTIVRTNDLRQGHTTSCGCRFHEVLENRLTTHGYTGSRLYRIWKNMKSRCYNKKLPCFKHYGQRGIEICDEWKSSFENFKNWSLNNGYSDNLTIDRIDVNGNYSPYNCRWVTTKEQSNNKRTTIYLELSGERHSAKEWSEILNINYSTLKTKIRKGDIGALL